MGKPSTPSFGNVRGGNGNDSWTINPSVLLNTIYDGRGGFDTLILNTSQNVSISVDNDTGNSKSWVAVGTGYSGAPLTQSSISTLPGAVAGTIVGIEKIVSGSGNDRLEARDGNSSFFDGGAGNDYLSTDGFGTDTLIGGTGQDYLRAYDRTILVGGTWNGNLASLPTGDGAVDRFQNAGTILDFEVGTDVLVFEGTPAQIGSAWYASTWFDSAGNGHDAIILNNWRGDHMFTLVGVGLEEVATLMGNAEYII